MTSGRPGRGADQFPLRLPPGLRDRIKAYAERHGRSMNTEIVRVLEREFPEPWTVEERVSSLLGLIATLKNAGSDSRIDTLSQALEETVQGIVTGRMQGVDEEARRRIQERFETWQIERNEDAQVQYTHNMDDDELAAFMAGKGTAKF
ncbi:Arc family DNA-binding protein [Mesorhizobium sp.]|uniref:Arc family DNA-binding protein n=1 Tax=Mesorhizobium sp. TaxID=1871066 RepID=UPI000FE8E9FB|nr:Arc family DNA-binding protein [Mesorhizobium sp.]RWM28503.1 MAG: Arc family DNA-binding protein [Mesorhizobium sp.]